MSSRALPYAVIGFSIVSFGLWVFLAMGGGGSLTDPADILTQGAQATSEADSFSMSLTVDGSFTDPETGTEMPLNGVTVDGDVDVAGEAAHVTFALPFLFGLTGEAIVLGEDMYLLTTLTGDKWIHTPASEDGEPMRDPPDPSEIADKVSEFLATEGVTAEKLADEACGDDTCYHIRVTVSAEAMAAHEGDMPDMGDMGGFGGMLPGTAFAGPVVVDMLFQHDGLWLRQVSTAAAEGESGAFALSLAFSNYNEPFDIAAPPADQVTEEGEFPLFPN
jgi:hypothetical protein